MKADQRFSISAKACTLKYNDQDESAIILNSRANYVIPIYQRPYSWADKEVRKFISDIFISFWGIDGNSIEEPMFIGTMQLSGKNANREQDIIDGQQRLTTLLILIKVLKAKFPACKEISQTPLDWLSTKVSNSKQQLYLEEVLTGEISLIGNTQNPYLVNALLINEIIEEQIGGEEKQSLLFDIERFSHHLLSHVYFVVIETRAGLSKTIQIFNAINTTGLDLNGGDIFKIRMYEYLRDKKGKDETAFDEISKLYEQIDERNAKLAYRATDITGILGIYQYILIARYNLPVVLYSYATDTFFERLFDTLFKISQWEHFKNNIGDIDLSVEDIEKIVNVRFEWEENSYKTCEDACSVNFIWLSRYSRYWNLIFVFLYKFKGENDYWDKMLVFTRQLSKLYIIYSIRFLKAVNEIHSFTYLLLKEIINGSFESTILLLNNKIGKLEKHKGWGDLENVLEGNIAYNAKIKNIACRLSAMLAEDYNTNDNVLIEKISKGLFETAVDIEHIQSYHDKNGEKREDIWNEWQENINSLGNLMILERRMNQSISNNPYETKIKSYGQSKFSIVRRQSVEFLNWNLDNCLIRKQKEIQKIFAYIFN